MLQVGQGADGLDPNKPVTHADLLPAKGGAGRGEAKGAAVEAIGGAIGGDAGKGAAIGAGVGAAGGTMKNRQSEKEREAAAEHTEQQYGASVQGYQPAFGAYMEGRGYTVK